MTVSISCNGCINGIDQDENTYCDNCFDGQAEEIKKLEDQVANLEEENKELEAKLVDIENDYKEEK